MRFEEDLFGPCKKYHVWTDNEELNVGDEITLVNSNCEFYFDNVTGSFSATD